MPELPVSLKKDQTNDTAFKFSNIGQSLKDFLKSAGDSLGEFVKPTDVSVKFQTVSVEHRSAKIRPWVNEKLSSKVASFLFVSKVVSVFNFKSLVDFAVCPV